MSGFIWLDVVDESGGSIVDATSSQKGVIQLTQDLAGTAAAPIVNKIHGATIPVAGSLTTGQPLLVSGVSALSYGALNLANIDAVTGTLPSTNMPSADASNIGAIKLAQDIGGTALLPSIVSLTGSAGIVTTAAQITQTALANNSATVYKGEFLRIVKTISLIQGGTGNFDTTIWQTPARFRLVGMALRFASTVTYGALGASVLSLGTAAGGAELMAAYTLLGTETTSTVPVGNALAQLGTDLAAANNYQKMYMAATTFSFRNAVAAGSITAGSVEIELLGYQF